jgi:hypothetical protein
MIVVLIIIALKNPVIMNRGLVPKRALVVTSDMIQFVVAMVRLMVISVRQGDLALM